MKYPAIETTPLDPYEKLRFGNNELKTSIVDFWRWNQSDLIENRNRGILSEFIVISALGIETNTRLEWDAYDLVANDNTKIEVKSAAYIQAWEQSRLSSIKFDIAPKKQLQPDNNYTKEKVRAADIYIFCLLHHKDQDTINPIELNQWTFYLVLKKVLDETIPEQKSITISTIERLLHEKCNYLDLKECFDRIIQSIVIK
jgi:hypothetical protein